MPGIPLLPGGELTADVVRTAPPDPNEPIEPAGAGEARHQRVRPPAAGDRGASGHDLPSPCTATA